MNLREILRGLGIRFWESGESPLVTGGWLGIVCPYCGIGTGKPGLGIHVRTLRCSCWKCGSKSATTAIAAAAGVPAGKVRAALGDRVPERTEPAPVCKLAVPPGVGPLLPAHRRYLAGRGFDPDEIVARWGVGGLGPDAGVLKWRLYIPIADEFGAVVSWTTRAVGNVPHGQRYRGAKREQSSVPRGDVLYGAHHARHAVIVTEGPTDAWWGGPGFVATAGLGFSPGQVARLAQYPVRAILFDADFEAQKRARKLAAQLAPFPGETHVVQTSGPDPAASPAAERDEIRSLFLE